MKKNVVLSLFLILVACEKKSEVISGFDKSGMKIEIAAGEDFYMHSAGTWMDKTEIPASESVWGSFHVLRDSSQFAVRRIIEKTAATNNATGSDAEKIAFYYNSYMDSVQIESLNFDPIKGELEKISQIKDKKELAKHFAYFAKIGIQSPFSFYVYIDDKNSSRYISNLNQSGLTLPDRDYYLKDDEKMKMIREKYLLYISKTLELVGFLNTTQTASMIMDLEKQLAVPQMSRVEMRDDEKTYNLKAMSEVKTLFKYFDWANYTNELGITNETEIIVRQPLYVTAFDKIFQSVSLDNWKKYLQFKLIHSNAALMSSAFVNAQFEFFGKVLSGQQENKPRWKRAVTALNGDLGELLGKLYVESYFQPAAKKRMQELVANLRSSLEERIKGLEWMSSATKEKALDKLKKFNPKIGYPDIWKDYSALSISKENAVQNSLNSNLFQFNDNINKLGKAIDRNEWLMTPQTVNAYYNPTLNEIVFPAAILQAPFFNMAADDAVNYGGIGAVIGHELTHGFDDQGRKYDGDGNLKDWWTKEDGDEFVKRAQVMVNQYNQYQPIPGDSIRVNGNLTLGENIADLGGLTVAYYAYKKSLNGKEAPIIDGLTGEQRFFYGWAQVWRTKLRDEALRNRLLTDPHSPGYYRTNGVLSNMPEFYDTFQVKAGSAMFRDDSIRVKIW